MTTRALTAVVLSCGIAGLGGIQPDSPVAHSNQEQAVPDVPHLLGFDLTGLELPPTPGEPFSTTVPLDGQLYSLDLQPRSLRAHDFQLLVDSGDGQLQPVDPLPPSTYRGTVRGVAGSVVAASLIDGQLTATIHFDDEDIWLVEPLRELAGPGAPAGFHAVYRDTDALPPVDRWCGTTDDMVPPGDDAGGGNAGGGGIASTGLRIIDLACDADVEFWQKNSSNTQTTMYDIENVINNYMETIYERDLDLTLEVTTIVVRTGGVGDDPYTTNDCSSLLGQFRSVWRSTPELSIRRDAAQLFTGKNLSGCLGISYLATTCDNQWHYSVVESRAPGLSMAYRTALSAHELGHTFNASHCDGDSDCRIMCSGLGGCTGGITSFGSRATSEIRSFASTSGCLGDLEDPPTLPFFDEFPTGALSPFNWSYNDGGFITSAGSNEPSPPNSLTLDSTGAGDYQDNEVRTNFINLDGLDDAGVLVIYYTQHQGPAAGESLTVSYWAGSQWSLLERIVSDGVDQSEFTMSVHDLTGIFPNPFHDEFRLRFETDGNASSDDWYIDNVLIGFEPPPDNDSCENPQAVGSGTFAFSTVGATTDGVPETCSGGVGGTAFENDVWFLYTPDCDGQATFSVCNDADFDTRLAVYNLAACPPFTDLGCSDDAPGCGVTSELKKPVFIGNQYFVRIGSGDALVEGDGNLTITCVPFAQPCPCDCEDVPDNTVDVGDFLALLAQWGTAGPCDCEDPPDGVVDVGDFLALLATWGDCP
ncbi:MAG: M12 family metallo-peptidase [Planctomycetota bacterium]